MTSENLNFRDRFGILLEKRLSGVAELRYKMLYGKCEFNDEVENEVKFKSKMFY
jgi:hypothetical protein